MGMVGARELLPAEAPALAADVNSLCGPGRRRSGRGSTSSRRLPAAMLSAGRGARGGAALAVSSGLLGVATPAELEGIVAHEIAHLRNRDVLTQTVAAVDRGRDRRVLADRRLLPARASSSFSRRWRRRSSISLLSPNREYEADRYAAELCDSPHGLADGLLRLEQAMGLVAFQASPATEPLYTTNPFAEEGLAALFARIRRSASASAGCARSIPTGARSSGRPSRLRTRKGPSAGASARKKMGGVLLSREIALRVPSALAGLTSLFGMGRGVSPPL